MKTVFYGGDLNLTSELLTGKTITQTFVAEESCLNSFGVMFATYKRDIVGCKVLIGIKELFGRDLYSCFFGSADFIDNDYLKINCGLTLIVGKRYELFIRCQYGIVKDTVTAKWNCVKRHVLETFKLNENIREGELDCYFCYGVNKTVESEKNNIESDNVIVEERVVGLVSVTIPCWNTSQYLKRALDSVYSQTYNFVEVFVVDDCSDDSAVVCDIIKNYPCKYIRLENRSGAPVARNTGWRAATGEFLYFCDSDVKLSPCCFEKSVQALHDNGNADWAYGNFHVGEQAITFYPFDKERLYLKNCSSTMSMVRASKFLGFDPLLKRFQDWDAFLTMSANGSVGVWVDDFLFYAEDRVGITKGGLTYREGVYYLRQKHKRQIGFDR